MFYDEFNVFNEMMYKNMMILVLWIDFKAILTS